MNRRPDPTPRSRRSPLPRALSGGRLYWLWVPIVGFVVGGIVISSVLRDRLYETLERERVLQEALIESSRLLGVVVEMENGLRGFLLSEDSEQLRAYQVASKAWPEQFGQLVGLLDADAELRAILARLDQQSTSQQAELTALLALYDTRGPGAAFAGLRRDVDKDGIDSIRQLTFQLQRTLRDRLRQEQSRLRAIVDQRSLALYSTLAIGALASGLALVMMRRRVAGAQAEVRLRAEVRQSQRESRAKSLFVANMSHEIRTPMNAIFGFSRLLSDRLSDPVNRRYADAILASGRLLLGLIDDLLDLSKIEAGRVEIRRTPTRPRELVDDVVTVFSHLAERKNLKLQTRIAADFPDTLLVDGARLRQVLFNLVGNAVKYTDAGVITLHLRGRPEPGQPQRVSCRLAVCDTGIGIRRDELAGIFDPFTRAQDVEQGPRAGSGLGLSIARQLVQLMGGTIRARSRYGRGSIFHVHLRGVALTQLRGESGVEDGALQALPASTILIVDDVELNRELLQAMFADTHHTTLIASSGEEALQIARTRPTDLILMDVRMPGWGGVETLRRLRLESTLEQTRIIAVTASSLSGEQERLREQFDGYISKPLSPESVYRELARVLGHTGGGTPRPQPLADELRVALAPAEVLREVHGQLQVASIETWPDLLQTMALHEVRAFAATIQRLATEAGAPELTNYATALQLAVATFDVTHMEALLREFPERVKQFGAYLSTDHMESSS